MKLIREKGAAKVAVQLVTVDSRRQTFSDVVREVEKRYLTDALIAAKGNQTKAAEIAGMSYSAFRRRLSNYDVEVEASISLK